MSNDLIPAIYEAAFTFEGIRVRVDILSRNEDDTFDIVEVKSSTSVKPEHVADAAIQLHVVEGTGASVKNIFLLHINNTYVYEGGSYDLTGLFQLEEITQRARKYLSSIPRSLGGMWEALGEDDAPVVEIGSHCTKPYTCSFYSYCRQDAPKHHIEQLPRVNAKLLEELRASGFRDIRDIPDVFESLSDNQQRVRDSVVTGRPYVNPELSDALNIATHPLNFLDFETFNPALPAYPGTRPYQIIPFQWSLHSQGAEHSAFLHEGQGDPREAFAYSLIDALGPEGSIVVYSSYERTIIRHLAEEFPHLAERLFALSDRLFDLLKVIRESYYHPEFHGSYSIKSVLPVLVQGLSYVDLGIQGGMAASFAYPQMLATDTPVSEKANIKQSLLTYCQRDTEAMVKIFEALLAESSDTGG